MNLKVVIDSRLDKHPSQLTSTQNTKGFLLIVFLHSVVILRFYTAKLRIIRDYVAVITSSKENLFARKD